MTTNIKNYGCPLSKGCKAFFEADCPITNGQNDCPYNKEVKCMSSCLRNGRFVCISPVCTLTRTTDQIEAFWNDMQENIDDYWRDKQESENAEENQQYLEENDTEPQIPTDLPSSQPESLSDLFDDEEIDDEQCDVLPPSTSFVDLDIEPLLTGLKAYKVKKFNIEF